MSIFDCRLSYVSLVRAPAASHIPAGYFSIYDKYQNVMRRAKHFLMSAVCLSHTGKKVRRDRGDSPETLCYVLAIKNNSESKFWHQITQIAMETTI